MSRSANSEKRKRFALWIAIAAAQPQRVEIENGVRLYPDAAPNFDWTGADPAAVTLQIVEPLDCVVAVAFVGEAINDLVALGGTPLASGMVLVHPTDRIDVGANSYWLSEDLAPLRATYDPAQHEPNARCRVTKAPLKKGQEIVLCPGVTGVDCDVIYRADVWDTMLAENRNIMKCHACGYRPDQPHWCPPAPKTRKEPLCELRHFTKK